MKSNKLKSPVSLAKKITDLQAQQNMYFVKLKERGLVVVNPLCRSQIK